MIKLTKILISILAGLDVIVSIITPLFIGIILLAFQTDNTTKIIIAITTLGSAIFRSIKIGWMR